MTAALSQPLPTFAVPPARPGSWFDHLLAPEAPAANPASTTLTGQEDMTPSPAVVTLLADFNRAAKARPQAIVVNLRRTASLDTKLIAALIRMRQQAIRADLAVVWQFSDAVVTWLELTRVSAVFEPAAAAP